MKKVILNEKMYVLLSIVLLGVQMLFDTLNTLHLQGSTTIYIGAASMLLSVVSSGFKQYLDPRLPNGRLIVQCTLFVAFVAGGVLDMTDKLPLSEGDAAVVRTILTFVSSFIPIVLSKIEDIK